MENPARISAAPGGITGWGESPQTFVAVVARTFPAAVSGLMRVYIEVFRNSVPNRRAAARVLRELAVRWPVARSTFDLADRDRILRIQTLGEAVVPARVAAVLGASGYLCAPLSDDGAEAASGDYCLCFPSNNSAIC